MNTLPPPLKKLIDFFEKLPSIGPKTAKRLAFYLLRMPQQDLAEAAEQLTNLKKLVQKCTICFNLSQETTCSICQDKKRNTKQIAVVEDVLDLLSFEAGNQYQGVYHVLHGRIDPLNYIGPDDLTIAQLLSRIKSSEETISEIILATNPNMEGEATAMYIRNKIGELPGISCKITRLAYGLPIGGDLEFADYMTLQRAMEGRREF